MQWLTKNIHPSGPRLVRGEGVYVYDEAGRRYLDFASQTLNLLFGHGHARIRDRICAAMNDGAFFSSRFATSSLVRLAERLVNLAPQPLTKVNLKLVNGADANESAVKRIRVAHNNRRIVTFTGGHLGESIELLQANGKVIPDVLRRGNDFLVVQPPHFEGCSGYNKPDICDGRCLAPIEELLDTNRDVAGIMLEPVMVEAGVVSLGGEYLRRLRKLCDAHNIALVFDESQSFGWLGKPFCSDLFHVEPPDLITLGKGLAAGMPLAATVMKPEYDCLDYGLDEFTHGAHPWSVAAAAGVLQELAETSILDELPSKSNRISSALADFKKRFEQVTAVRAVGLIFGIEFATDCALSNVVKKTLERGLIVRTVHGIHGPTIVLKPPIIVQVDQIDSALSILDDVLTNQRHEV